MNYTFWMLWIWCTGGSGCGCGGDNGHCSGYGGQGGGRLHCGGFFLW